MNTVEQQIAIYKNELKSYKLWCDSIGLKPHHNPIAALNNRDWQLIQSKNAAITAMEVILGLTEREIVEYSIGAGMHVSDAKKFEVGLTKADCETLNSL